MEEQQLRQQTQYLFAGTFRNIYAAFIVERRSRMLKAGTIRYYQDELDRFAEYLDQVGVIQFEELTADVIRKYLLQLGETRNKGGVHAAWRVIRALLNWYDLEYEPEGWRNPVKKIKLPGPSRRPLPGIKSDDVFRMIAACRTGLADRDKAILLFLLDSGVRAFELLALNVSDVNLITGAVVVKRGKGDKRRVTFLAGRSKRALRKYLKSRPKLEPLFTTDENTRLSYSGLVNLIRRRAKDAGVPPPGAHDFRRCFGIECYRNGMTLLEISKLLGHDDTRVTQRYLDLDQDDLQAAHRRASPADNSRL